MRPLAKARAAVEAARESVSELGQAVRGALGVALVALAVAVIALFWGRGTRHAA